MHLLGLFSLENSSLYIWLNRAPVVTYSYAQWDMYTRNPTHRSIREFMMKAWHLPGVRAHYRDFVDVARFSLKFRH